VIDTGFGGREIREPKMPSTLPSPVDRGEFRFVAVDASGAVWRWVDEDMVWVRDPRWSSPAMDDAEPSPTVH